MLHTVIQGSSGSGKSIVSHILSKIYLKLGFLRNGTFIVAKRSDLIGEYLGQTAAKTQRVINKADGGVLFIDEAYSLGNAGGRDSYSKECIDTLVANLAEKRKFVCIIAGYKDDLQKCFFSRNSGLERRFPWTFTIDDYKSDELKQIFEKQVNDFGWELEDDLGNFFETNIKYFPKFGGDTETLLSKVKIAHSRRVFGKPRRFKKVIIKKDIDYGFEIFKEYQRNNDLDKNDSPPRGMYT